MRFLDLTLPTAAENLALDEALLEIAETGEQAAECLRLWEPSRTHVVLGRSSRVHDEVDVAFCRSQDIDILRRSSGGASIVTGPGCLMYAVVLSYELRPELRMIEQAHRFVLERLVSAIQPLVPGIQLDGTSDLTVRQKKVSGNSLRCRRHHLLYHGTLLYDFPLELVGRCLRTPPRQPAYRNGRAHGDFLTNLPVSAASLRQALGTAWRVKDADKSWPRQQVQQLVADKYSQMDWNFRI